MPIPSVNNTYFENKSISEPANKSIVPQLRFFSTQKKRKRPNINKKPSKKQVTSINNMLSGKLEEYVSNDSKYDHAYL